MADPFIEGDNTLAPTRGERASSDTDTAPSSDAVQQRPPHGHRNRLDIPQGPFYTMWGAVPWHGGIQTQHLSAAASAQFLEGLPPEDKRLNTLRSTVPRKQFRADGTGPAQDPTSLETPVRGTSRK